ncbi:cytochrome c oxidase assembly factor 6 homolog isoform X3 [Globicephala melas]|uniref:cytochrome c oxidase assembly factor 6 homolog isoform X3 n=1 Tax=Globicephala melas TaxID=9731 RepID=UPI00293D963E|nr:cytochrome c oxidase assembly factor 6 homolog isoform X6 [Globicephala melas]
MAAPSMKERQACWGARDEYWKCLDENTEDASRCKKLRSSFESSCPQQWGPGEIKPRSGVEQQKGCAPPGWARDQ